MPNIRKHPDEHALNGNPGRRNLPEVRLPGTTEPIGFAPRAMPPAEKREWDRIVKIQKHLTTSNEVSLELASEVMAEYRALKRWRRRLAKELKEAGGDPTDAGLDVDGKPTPKLKRLDAMRALSLEYLREFLMTPKMQVQAMAPLAVAKFLSGQPAEHPSEHEDFSCYDGSLD